MRILVVGTQVTRMMNRIQAGLNPRSVKNIRRAERVFELTDGSEIHVAKIKYPSDWTKLAGQTFDFIIEDSSFRKDAEMFYNLKLSTQR